LNSSPKKKKEEEEIGLGTPDQEQKIYKMNLRHLVI
jgi:hypothetical protein